MRRSPGLLCGLLMAAYGALAARCPPLPPVPPDLPATFCDPAGGWEALPSLPAGGAVPGLLLEPLIMTGVQQALANVTGWAPRPLPQLSATVEGCRRTVCGWFFWLRLNITCPHNGGQGAAELMLALPGRSRSGLDRTPLVTVLDLDLVEAGPTEAELAAAAEEEAAAAQEAAAGPPSAAPVPHGSGGSGGEGASTLAAGDAGPGRPAPLPAQFCGEGWAAVPGFDGLPAHLVDSGVVEQLQSANPVPCPLQDRYLAADGCADDASATRFWLRLGVSCGWRPEQVATTEVLLQPEAGPGAADAAHATAVQLELLAVLKCVEQEGFKRRRQLLMHKPSTDAVPWWLSQSDLMLG